LTKYGVKIMLVIAFCGVAAFTGLVQPAFMVEPVSAKPAYMDRYNRDSYSKIDMRSKCTVCHIGHGGGERNDFGEAFEDAGFRITIKLREKFPDLFEQQPPADK
jgi:hypothetical protein